MKKHISIILVILIMLPVFSACASAPQSPVIKKYDPLAFDPAKKEIVHASGGMDDTTLRILSGITVGGLLTAGAVLGGNYFKDNLGKSHGEAEVLFNVSMATLCYILAAESGILGILFACGVELPDLSK